MHASVKVDVDEKVPAIWSIVIWCTKSLLFIGGQRWDIYSLPRWLSRNCSWKSRTLISELDLVWGNCGFHRVALGKFLWRLFAFLTLSVLFGGFNPFSLFDKNLLVLCLGLIEEVNVDFGRKEMLKQRHRVKSLVEESLYLLFYNSKVWDTLCLNTNPRLLHFNILFDSLISLGSLLNLNLSFLFGWVKMVICLLRLSEIVLQAFDLL